MQDLKARAVRGGLAKTAAQAAHLFIRLSALVILARLLDPTDFGLVAMVTVVTGLLNLFRDFGLSTAAVQRPNITDQQISTLFWINVLIGLVLTGLTAASAPLIVAFYGDPRLFWVTIALASAFLLNALGVQHAAMLQRRMRFVALATVDTLSLIVSFAVGIGMAARGFGYWALVGMTLAQPFAFTALVWMAGSWMPGRPSNAPGLAAMIRFGGTLTLNGVIVYLAYNLEKVLLGKAWGADALGIYGRGYQLVNIPVEGLNSAVGQVAMSALSRIREDPDRLRSYFLKGYSLVVSVTVPITLTCALFAHDLVLVLLGPKWVDVSPVLRFLAPTILVFALINPTFWLLVPLGLVNRSLKIALVLAPLVIAGYVLGLPHGPVGVALGYSVVMMLWVVPHLAWCVHGTPISLVDILHAVVRPLFAGALSAALAWAMVGAFLDSASHILRLALGIALLLAAYVVGLFYVMGQKSFYLEVVRGIAGRT
jgi:PST family polysaccharide transporter